MAEQTAYQRAKALVGAINWGELYTLLLITFGVPGIAWLWFNWKVAVTTFITVQVALGILRLRVAK